ncbi:unnamed protein product, partial [Larinioides sclopetarius]
KVFLFWELSDFINCHFCHSNSQLTILSIGFDSKLINCQQLADVQVI